MPADRLLQVHTIDVLDPTYPKGSMMTVHRTYEMLALRQLKCNVTPLTAIEREELHKKGYVVSHAISFCFDPTLKIGNRIRFKGTTMRIVPPINFSTQDRIWSLMAMAHLDDNPDQGTVS